MTIALYLFNLSLTESFISNELLKKKDAQLVAVVNKLNCAVIIATDRQEAEGEVMLTSQQNDDPIGTVKFQNNSAANLCQG